MEQILSLKSRPHFRRATSCRDVNWKSHKLFPFLNIAQKHESVSVHLNSGILSYVHKTMDDDPLLGVVST